MTQAYPLAWPAGWPRTPSVKRKDAQFGKTEMKLSSSGNGSSWRTKRRLSIEDAIKRVRIELERLGVDAREDMIVSTNLKLNLAGIPRGNQGEPADPGVAVYFQKPRQPTRVMAIDAYSRVADNLGAIAATLEAMRAIERHGGAQILDRAFTGFEALPAPHSCWDILGLSPGASEKAINDAFRDRAKRAHPDAGGSDAAMAELNRARDEALQTVGGWA